MAGAGTFRRRVTCALKAAGFSELRLEPASWMRRVACMAYEALIVIALVLVGGLVGLALPSGADGVEGLPRLALQVWVGSLVGAYFAGCWWRFGQTLAMKTWRLLVTKADTTALSPFRALLRLLLATLTLPVGMIWALIDRDHLFLHDRLAGTRVWRILD
jgi:uncharacterized RDD family membrane protein YckC